MEHIDYSDGYPDGDKWVDGYWYCEECHGTSRNGGNPSDIVHKINCQFKDEYAVK